MRPGIAQMCPAQWVILLFFFREMWFVDCSYNIHVCLQANMFQPVHRRVEMVSEQQRDMEQAFERLFVKTHGKHL